MELHYFLTTNGSMGHSDYVKSATKGYEDVLYLDGFPRALTHALVKECYAMAKQQDREIHIIHNCLDNSMEGIFLPEQKTALIGRPLYEKRTDIFSLFSDENLDEYCVHFNRAQDAFFEAKKVHDDWEKIYIGATDYDALNRYCDDLLATLLDGKIAEKKGTVYNRFFGSATIDGSLDYVANLSAGLKRYFIKGRPGTGKSTFMKKLAKKAVDMGFDAECYHCSFDPNSLDMVAVRSLGFCVFDSTSPHEYFPTLQTDEILDFYQASVAPKTDETYANELAEISARYKALISSAVKHLIGANNACKEAENAILPRLDTDRIQSLKNTVLKRLFA